MANRFSFSRRVLFSIITCAFLSACSGNQSASEPRKEYELKGKVVSVDKEKREVMIAHEEIKGFMAGMTMSFPIKDEWALANLAPGDVVQATLVVTEKSFWLENIVSTRQTPISTGANNQTQLAEPQTGAQIPNFTLLNQDGKRLKLEQYKGKALLLTFIYTRCPLPEYCARMSDRFAVIEKELQKNPALYEKTHLLSISFDLEHDTPQVLRSYGAAHTGRFTSEKFDHWEFATGTKDEIKAITKFFGLTYTADGEQINHSLSTALISHDGKLQKIYRGNDWKPEEVLREIEKLVGQESNQ